MKRLIPFLLLFALLMQCGTKTRNIVNLASQKVPHGKGVKVDIVIEHEEPIYGIELEFCFDPDQLKILESHLVDCSRQFQLNWGVQDSSLKFLIISFTRDYFPEDTPVVIRLPFIVRKKYTGPLTFGLKRVVLADKDGEPLPVESSIGMLTAYTPVNKEQK